MSSPQPIWFGRFLLKAKQVRETLRKVEAKIEAEKEKEKKGSLQTISEEGQELEVLKQTGDGGDVTKDMSPHAGHEEVSRNVRGQKRVLFDDKNFEEIHLQDWK